jgi:hypothetical protein
MPVVGGEHDAMNCYGCSCPIDQRFQRDLVCLAPSRNTRYLYFRLFLFHFVAHRHQTNQGSMNGEIFLLMLEGFAARDKIR